MCHAFSPARIPCAPQAVARSQQRIRPGGAITVYKMGCTPRGRGVSRVTFTHLCWENGSVLGHLPRTGESRAPTRVIIRTVMTGRPIVITLSHVKVLKTVDDVRPPESRHFRSNRVVFLCCFVLPVRNLLLSPAATYLERGKCRVVSDQLPERTEFRGGKQRSTLLLLRGDKSQQR